MIFLAFLNGHRYNRYTFLCIIWKWNYLVITNGFIRIACVNKVTDQYGYKVHESCASPLNGWIFSSRPHLRHSGCQTNFLLCKAFCFALQTMWNCQCRYPDFHHPYQEFFHSSPKIRNNHLPASCVSQTARNNPFIQTASIFCWRQYSLTCTVQTKLPILLAYLLLTKNIRIKKISSLLQKHRTVRHCTLFQNFIKLF